MRFEAKADALQHSLVTASFGGIHLAEPRPAIEAGRSTSLAIARFGKNMGALTRSAVGS
jgi:hypothetical protein